jgi:hypothetical protein
MDSKPMHGGHDHQNAKKIDDIRPASLSPIS